MGILVTGGAGYVGSHTVLALCGAGEPVVVLDDLSTGCASAVPAHVPLCVEDVGNPRAVATILRQYRIDTVLHFAGSAVVADSVADPIRYYHNNTVASLKLIETAIGCGVRFFLFSSSAAVYAGGSASPLPETAPTGPDTPYGASKLMTETMLRDACRRAPMRYAILRYFNVAGADPAGRCGQSSRAATHLVKVACEVAVGRRNGVSIFGTDYPTPDGTCIRDYIHVSDLAEAHWLALRRLRAGDDSLTINCGYGRGVSVRQVLRTVERVSGRQIAVREAPRRAGDMAISIADPTLARTLLGWHPRHEDLDRIVADALAWERKSLERVLGVQSAAVAGINAETSGAASAST
ncbi:UDP-glucose 4-epimerase GalE [Mangrovicella endophytica]|uniref:UDP-glucose 4-epimerase GalE n=1 Tax=Mangrovicella endophytica TaxID=2066697 RepID=UPI000C9DB206|nr:UDP-glucose 4-epimerase GalE [Mangrovicella endophytica]